MELLRNYYLQIYQRVSPKRDRSPSFIGTQTPQLDEKYSVFVLHLPCSTGDNVYVETPKKLLSNLKMMIMVKVKVM